MKTLLTAVVGSRSHGTAGPDSDTDTRSIYQLPTSEILSIGTYNKFIENKETDSNAWEISQALYLALWGNPSVLEVFKCIPELCSDEGQELRDLFPAFLNRKHVYNAFRGFATGQRKKMISPTTNYHRKGKASSHYLRVLWNGIELLSTGDMTVRIIDTEIGRSVFAAKRDELLFEEVLQIGDDLTVKLDLAYEKSTLPLEADKAKINEFLLRVRRAYW